MHRHSITRRNCTYNIVEMPDKNMTIEAEDAELGEGGRLPSLFGVDERIDLECNEDCSSSTEGNNKGTQDQDAPALETTITNSPPQQQHHSDGLKPILIQIPTSIPLGIDIDMTVPIVSYIQPSSPLRNHVSVGDIILVVNGKNITKWNHLELYSLFSGRPQDHCSDGDDENQSPRMTNLVFLPRKFMQQQHSKKLEANESAGEARTGGEGVETSDSTDSGNNVCVNDKVKSSPTAASTEPTTTPSSPPTTRIISSTCFSSSLLLSTPDKIMSASSGNDILQKKTHQHKHSSSFSSPITTVTRTSLTSSSSSSSSVSSSIASSGDSDVGNDNDIVSHNYPEEIETISTNQESTSRGNIPFLDYLERKVGELNEKNKSKSVYPDSANVGLSLSNEPAVSVTHQQQGTDSNASVVDDDSTRADSPSAKGNDCVKTSVDEDDIARRVGVEKSERTEENETIVEEGIERNGNDSMGEYQLSKSKAFQDDNLDERDRRRRERMNREQPQIEYVNISNEAETDISTLFGGVWIKELNFTAHRVEDSIMNHMEEGERKKVLDLISQQPQLQQHGVKSVSSVKRNWIIDMIIVILIVLGVIGIIAIAAVFIKRD